MAGAAAATVTAIHTVIAASPRRDAASRGVAWGSGKGKRRAIPDTDAS
jgi:hypothetical protein